MILKMYEITLFNTARCDLIVCSFMSANYKTEGMLRFELREQFLASLPHSDLHTAFDLSDMD